MIILEGPDATGKTTLAKLLSTHGYLHYDQHTQYKDFLADLVSGKHYTSVLDRSAFSEIPYSIVMNRKNKLTLKEMHNLFLLYLAYDPVIVLFTHKADHAAYTKDQYLPYKNWDSCLAEYRKFFSEQQIPFVEYDYLKNTPGKLLLIEEWRNHSSSWWLPMWKEGFGFIGSHSPDVLLVAERMGPSNLNNLPFQEGPTGYMLSDVLSRTNTPLGTFAVTNMVKSHRGDIRGVNYCDLSLLEIEIKNLMPKKVILMGRVARAAIPVLKQFGIPYDEIEHLGALHHRGVMDLTKYCAAWTLMTKGKKDIFDLGK